MKISYSRLGILFLGAAILAGSCKKVLQENPHTVFTVDYFKTPDGIQNGVNALYSGMRFYYGNMDGTIAFNSGTDEATLGDQGYNSSTESSYGDYSINSANGHNSGIWSNSFPNINLANAVVQFAPGIAALDPIAKDTIIAQARFLRGLYYFNLVQQFGAVPLDLGAGILAFNESAFQGFNRLPTADLFVKDYQVIIADFSFAAQKLRDQRPTTAFRLSKSAALHMLAKAYLFRGYSAAKVATDFDSAYKVAMNLISNQSQYGTSLLPDYGDVFKEGNEYNSEILYAVERIPGDQNDNEVLNPTSFDPKTNIEGNMWTANYQNNYDIPRGSGKFPCDRVVKYMRPLRQLVPTPYVYNIAFIDKFNDSRYDNTFRTVWTATNNNCSALAGINSGDTCYFLAPYKGYGDSLRALGTKKYAIINPDSFYVLKSSKIQLFPSIKKYDDNKRTGVSDYSGRPTSVCRLGETYLLAAEAAIEAGHAGDALPLITTLRTRAAYRAGIPDLSTRQTMIMMRNAGTPEAPDWRAITTADMTQNFIMEERTRELFGENVRWPDLACRGLLVSRVQAYNPLGGSSVKATNALRPVPQTQLDAITDPDKIKYQNPGY
ncbi:MAG: RagB/SusD family nutrient uptake outer membrane protein [Chitinophagaceae bacterium]|nr:RagB/SusD family nutrient uptake outer membrane protein [Chitinophagaceae bacterium]